MDYSRVKIKARELRKQGKTYSEIQRELAIKVPKSTLSFWLHDIPQSVEQLNNAIKVNKSNLNLARGKAREVNLKKRKSYLNELKERNHYNQQHN